jgi:GGDEF domain-containing protein
LPGTTTDTPVRSAAPATEKDDKHHDYGCFAECYALALRSASEHALDFDPPATLEFQRHVDALEERITPESTNEVLRSVQSSFRGELRQYLEKGQAFLKRVREELDAAAEAMRTFASALVANGADVQERVKSEMKTLEKVADTGDLAKIRESVRAAAREVARSYDELNKANAIVIAELQHEIRLLHREMDAERRVAWTDVESGAWIKKKLEDRLDELLKTTEPFCVIVILVTNLKRVEKQCSPAIVHTALHALIKRFYSLVGEDGLVARLGGEQFAAVIEVDASAGQAIAHDLGERLSSRYSAQNNGISQSIDLRVTCGIVGHTGQGDPAEFRRKMQQMTGPPENPA